MASSSVAQFARQVRPILSTDHAQARRRVLALYKAWVREAPFIVMDYNIPYSRKQCLEKIRSEFMKHKHVTDLRVIDLLVLKGHMEFMEIINMWKPVGNLLFHFKDTHNPKPKDFLGKFLAGHE
ncbi:hypothetical protein KPH14_011944 [Odynerus spinipes]|uniref:NADH dehydrogenase [ubiquinone] 1 alpha subcomplex subunit 6 n=1 Tax=Odynerus spinipes TaxID=1348599 RepID=A0AAD9RDF2_9HYME|nr:hypothetical protein KPH14_011944 [Odynerus spinipes]